MILLARMCRRKATRNLRVPISAAVVIAVAANIPTAFSQSTLFDRDRDPVVIVGADLESLQGAPVGQVVAFQYDGGWQQVPVQIDERKYVDYGVVYNQAPVGLGALAYTDATTYTGPDTDPTFDVDDELVFMAKDAGGHVGAGLPAGVLAGTGLEIEITDPLDGGTGYVYLFQSDGSLTPAAGQDYVTYDFVLLTGSGVYKEVYNTLLGPNPEDSVAVSAYYRTHFSDRWIREELNVFAGGSTGVDVLDRHKIMLGPGNCGRTEQTFSDGEGAFFANKDGPVRCIRSYMGSNSGPANQRDHFFYERRHDIVSYLRVHGGIAGPMDLYDYSPAAIGMSYFNDLNTLGVPVDGQPDSVSPGVLAWEMVTGLQGSLIISHSFETDIDPLNVTSYYSDDETPSVTQCTGDAYEYATSGPWVDQVMPNTDPYLGAHNNLTFRRIVYPDAPGQSVATAALRDAQAQTPLTVAMAPYPPSKGDYDGDGDVDLDDYVRFPECMTGPEGGPVGDKCDVFDFEPDDDVDLADFAAFQMVFGN